jgi:hypothetical protein
VGRNLKIVWQEDTNTLYRRYQNEKEFHRRIRLEALWLMKRGKSLVEISDLLRVPYRSLQRWVKWYREDGIEAITKRIPGYKSNGKHVS